MEKVKALVSYNLRNLNDGRVLRMLYGRILDSDGSVNYTYTAQRWCFYGTKIPMPVRSGTWFVGLSVSEMLEWLRREGWDLQTRVVIGTGYAQVYEPSQKGNESCKGNECCRKNEDEILAEQALLECIKDVYSNYNRLTAVRIYKHTHQCSICEANNAVREMVNA